MQLSCNKVFFAYSVPPRAQAAYGRRNEVRRNPALRRRDGKESPFAGHALELLSAALLKLQS